MSQITFTTTATATYSAGNTVAVASTTNMFPGLPIVFTGNTFGNITTGTTYYIGDIVVGYPSSNITLTTLPGGSTYGVTNATGNMTATFSQGGQQIIPTVAPGEPLNQAFTAVNVNFDQIWAAGPVDSNIQITDNSILTTNTNGNINLVPNGIGNVVSSGHILPNSTRIRNLGSPSQKWLNIYAQYLTVDNASLGNIGNITIDVANLHITGGSNGYVLQTDGTGNLTWTAQTGGTGNGVPGGANTQIQYNDAGAFGATAGFTFDNTSNALSVPGSINLTDGTVIQSSGGIEFPASEFEWDLHSSDGNVYIGALPNEVAYIDTYSANISVRLRTNGVNDWIFDPTGRLTTPGEAWIHSGDSYNSIVFTPNGVDNNGQIKVDNGQNMIVSATSNFYVKQAGSDRIAVTDTNTDLMAAANVRIQSNKAGSANTWTFDTTGNLTLPGTSSNINYSNGVSILDGVGSSYGDSNVVTLLADFGSNTVSTTGNITAGGFTTSGAQGNITGANYITANYFVGDGGLLSNVGALIQSNSAPNDPTSSTMWWDTVSGSMFVWYTDINGSQWVPASPTGIDFANVSSDIIPSANNVFSLGNATNQWASVYVGANTLYLNNVPVGINGNVLTVNGANVITAEPGGVVSTTGNIVGGDFYYGNGTPVSGSGPVGATGPAGSAGATGPTGATGANGTNGATGATGTAGTNGATGATGANGTNGATGATGTAGTNGATGATGLTGATGSFSGNLAANVNGYGYSISNVATISATSTITADIIAATNNGNGTSFKVGDDAWIGDINSADTIGIRGQQNAANGYIVFGNVDNSTKLGRAGSGPLTYNSNFTLTYAPPTVTGAAITAQGANTNGGTGYLDFLKVTNQSGGATNPNKWFRINSTGALEIINSAYTATLFSIADNGNTVVQGNLQVTGNLSYVNTTNLNVTNALITLANAATTPAQANGGGIQLNGANANIIYTNGNDAWNFNKPVVVTGAVSATTTVSATGNVTGGNILTGGVVSATGNVTGNYILGNGALLTGVITSVANINSGTSNVTVVSSGGNITVGVGGTANVVQFATTGEYVTGVVSATGNVTGGNVLTGGVISSTGNITGGNISATNHTGTTVSVSGTVTSASVVGGVITGSSTSVTGTVTAASVVGGVMTGTSTSVSGNVTGGNVLTGGIVSATGNITGGNISATNHTGTTVSVTGNITAGNIINTGISSVTGNITGGNVLTGGVVSATGNITTANSFVGNLVGTTASVTGNVSAGNVIANNIIVNGQQTNYGVVTPAYMVVGLASSVSGFGSGSTVIFDTVVGNTNSQTSYNASTGVFTLTAGVAYDMSFTPSFITFTNPTTGYLCYQWVDATTNTPLDSTGTGMGTGISSQDTTAQQDNATARVIYTPTTNQTVKLLVTSGNGTVTLRGSIGTQAVIKPLNPTIVVTANPVGFRATTPVTNVSVNNGASATMLFGTEEVDTNSAYNPATGRFTPNAAGYYSIDWFIVTSANGAGELIASLYKNGVLVAWGTNQTTATAHWNGIGGSAGMIYLNGTTDYISITLTNNSGSTATILAASGLSYFSAYLIR